MLIHCNIRIKGIVQGVGFRPFIYRLATTLNLKGFILNTDDGVFIEIEGEKKRIKKFVEIIKKEPPPLAIIDNIIAEFQSRLKNYKKFTIKKSITTGVHHTLVSPDIALCDECLKELFDKNNRRFFYFGINCINCGPRFTIIKDLPYDRKNTSMNKFNMCSDCNNEYHNPLNRRYHSQPNCCSICGPNLFLYDNRKNQIKFRNSCELFTKIAQLINRGKIIAIKGIGGYHLVCDAENTNVVKELRKRKRRKHKPFAIMSKNIESIKKFCYLSVFEERLLKSRERPILLLRWKENDKIISKQVAPYLKYLGVMLPYTGTHYLLFNYVNKNLIFTSGNLSEEPIVFRDEEVFDRLGRIADYILTYNRTIVMNNDDSVLMEFRRFPYIIRRSRGFVPKPVITHKTKHKILGLGAQLKNCFALYFENKVIISQHIGDLENFETFIHFKNSLKHFCHLFSFKPDIVAYDLHPEYIITKYINEIVPVETRRVGVQHHFAHLVSCLLDNNIKDREEKFIGIAFDGVGYGDDGNLWGGEFFVFNSKEYKRVAHLKYTKMPGAEMAIKEPVRMCISYLYELYGDDILKKILFRSDKIENILYLIKNNINTPLTSSVGRLFDGVSALLRICSMADYEGEPAVLLENIISYKKIIDKCYNFCIEENDGKYIVNYNPIFEAIITDLEKKEDKESISIKFHNTIIEIILEISRLIRDKDNINKVALSGGVFQNRYLLHKTVEKLEKDKFKVLFHREIPTNDGGISAGQVIIAS